jgi:hypothetical protein
VVAEDQEDLAVHLEAATSVEALVEALAEEDSLAEAQVEAGKSILKDIKKSPKFGAFLFYFSLI